MSLKELNAQRDALAKACFHPEQIKRWRERGKADAAQDAYKPPHGIAELAEHVYCMAWCKRRDEIGKQEREEAEAAYAANPKG